MESLGMQIRLSSLPLSLLSFPIQPVTRDAYRPQSSGKTGRVVCWTLATASWNLGKREKKKEKKARVERQIFVEWLLLLLLLSAPYEIRQSECVSE